MIKSICLVRLSALGDVLMTVPLVRRLQAGCPDIKITWIISEPAYSLVAELEGVEFIVIKKPRRLQDYWAFRQMMKGRRFDVLLALQASLRANLLYPLISANRKIGYDARRGKDAHRLFIRESIEAAQVHTLEGFLQFGDSLNLPKMPPSWNIPWSPLDDAFAKKVTRGRPTVLINPASSKPERSWLTEHYIALIRHIQKNWDVAIVLTGGPGDYDQSLRDMILSEVICEDWVGKTRPKQLLALIHRSILMICPDTGPSHMATAVGTPVIALHAVTNPDISGPYLSRDKVVNYYPQAVVNILGKSCDSVPYGTQVHSDKSMALIPLDAVIQQVNKALEGVAARC